jgi:hypothetical protein
MAMPYFFPECHIELIIQSDLFIDREISLGSDIAVEDTRIALEEVYQNNPTGLAHL